MNIFKVAFNDKDSSSSSSSATKKMEAKKLKKVFSMKGGMIYLFFITHAVTKEAHFSMQDEYQKSVNFSLIHM